MKQAIANTVTSAEATAAARVLAEKVLQSAMVPLVVGEYQFAVVELRSESGEPVNLDEPTPCPPSGFTVLTSVADVEYIGLSLHDHINSRYAQTIRSVGAGA